MNRGAPQLSVTVVPDSGTDELAGLTGSMTIIIVPPMTKVIQKRVSLHVTWSSS